VESVYSKDRQQLALFGDQRPLKVSDIKNEVNSKYSSTDRNGHQFCKTLHENFNYTKVGEENSDVIWQYLRQLTSNFVYNCWKKVKSVAYYILHFTPKSKQSPKYYSWTFNDGSVKNVVKVSKEFVNNSMD
jgi:hypothetical protein